MTDAPWPHYDLDYENQTIEELLEEFKTIFLEKFKEYNKEWGDKRAKQELADAISYIKDSRNKWASPELDSILEMFRDKPPKNSMAMLAYAQLLMDKKKIQAMYELSRSKSRIDASSLNGVGIKITNL